MKKANAVFILVSLLFLGIIAATASPVAAACTPHAQKQCISNISYWYNSCGVLEEVYQNCNTTGQICQNGACVSKPADNQQNPPQTQAGQTDQNALVVSAFGQPLANTAGWSKIVESGNNSTVNFLITIKNISASPQENVSVFLDNAQGQITYTGQVMIETVSLPGDISSGIALGTVAPNTSKVISATGTINTQQAASSLQVNAQVKSNSATINTDAITINVSNQQTPANTGTVTVNPTNSSSDTTVQPAAQTTAAAPQENSILSNFKRNWYIWLIIIVILVVVFIIIFRRLSSEA
jgi:hypothetical protein